MTGPRTGPAGAGGLRVEFVCAVSAQRRVFDLSGWDASPGLLRDLGAAFRTATSSEAGTMRTMSSAAAAFRRLRAFVALLAQSERRPVSGRALLESDLTLARVRFSGRDFGVLRSVLRRNLDAWSEEVRRELFTPGKVRVSTTVESYSLADFYSILAAAREEVRRARDRIRPNLAMLQRWRESPDGAGLTPAEIQRGAVLDQAARTVDVPRWSPLPTGRAGQPNMSVLRRAGFESGTGVLHSLFLTQQEITAFMVLMIGVTGQNAGTLNRLTDHVHHATDPSERISATILETVKPRREPFAAHTDVVLADLPPWLHEGAGRRDKDLRTPFGVHALLVELGAPAREASGDRGLFAWYATSGGKGQMWRQLRSALNAKATALDWTRSRPVVGADGLAIPVSFQRMRLSFVQHQDRPVAHTANTLADQYQIRDRGGLARYQEKVADVLDEQVRHARATTALSFLTSQQVRDARTDPVRVAGQVGVRVEVLEQVLEGSADTVLSACTDNLSGPTGAGQPCRASFLLCLGCPCALATPAHWSAIVHTHDELVNRKQDMVQLDWAVRFGSAHQRLADVMNRLPAGAVERARSAVADHVSVAVTRMLDGEWDRT